MLFFFIYDSIALSDLLLELGMHTGVHAAATVISFSTLSVLSSAPYMLHPFTPLNDVPCADRISSWDATNSITDLALLTPLASRCVGGVSHTDMTVSDCTVRCFVGTTACPCGYCLFP